MLKLAQLYHSINRLIQKCKLAHVTRYIRYYHKIFIFAVRAMSYIRL